MTAKTNQSVPVEQISDADAMKETQTISEAAAVADEPEATPKAKTPAARKTASKKTETPVEETPELIAAAEEAPELVASEEVLELAVSEEMPELITAAEEAPGLVASEEVLELAVSEEMPELAAAPEVLEVKVAEEPLELVAAPERVAVPVQLETPVIEESVDFIDEGDPTLESEESADEEAIVNGAGAEHNGKTKAELVDFFAAVLTDKPIQSVRRDAEAIKVLFYKQHRADVEQLKNKFIEEGGDAEEFVAPGDASEMRLKELFAEYRKRRNEYISTIERSKEDNLKVKLHIVEELKELVNSSETVNNTFNAFRELQQRWKDAGPVPQANVKDLWETYNLHVENFYSFIKINKELRDLDLKRNYEAKITLCEEAEALILEPSVVNAFHKLQKLHEQWRETGPVAKEYKETLWERFREASGRINKQHQEYFDSLKDEQKANLDLKTELCIKTEELTATPMTSRKEWNKASDQLLEIQKVWKTIGFAPKKENAKVYERFRVACDRFFEQKRNFYSGAKTEMDHNLQLKTEICEAAEALQQNDDWKKTTDEIIALQRRWKEVGPVPRRNSDAIWKRFRVACDRFFEHKSHHFSNKDNEYDQNLERKRELLAQIAEADVLTGGFEMIKDYQRRWSEIGFVPIKQKDAIQKEYKAVMDKMFAALRGGEQNRSMDRFKGKVSDMKNTGDRRLKFERERLYNKVKQLESDIALLENNIGFFSKSKNAESMIRDVRDKIDRARREMAETIEKINLIDNQE